VDQLLTILLVDDSGDDRFFFRRALSRAGLQTQLFEAEDGVEAVEFLSNQGRFSDPAAFPRPRVVFLDLSMPGRNGFDVLRWLQTQTFRDELRVVVLSGSSEPHDRELAASLGANDYLVKPATVEKLKGHLAAF
jgi:two-component system response regulator